MPWDWMETQLDRRDYHYSMEGRIWPMARLLTRRGPPCWGAHHMEEIRSVPPSHADLCKTDENILFSDMRSGTY